MPYRPTQTDVEILEALNRLHYLTAAQLERLLYTPGAPDRPRYGQRRLKRLVDEGYVQRLRALPAPRFGSAPHVFTLANLGRRLLGEMGVELTSQYVRPSEEQAAAANLPFITHTLAAVEPSRGLAAMPRAAGRLPSAPH